MSYADIGKQVQLDRLRAAARAHIKAAEDLMDTDDYGSQQMLIRAIEDIRTLDASRAKWFGEEVKQ